MAGDPEKSRPRAASFPPSVSLSADLKSSSTSVKQELQQRESQDGNNNQGAISDCDGEDDDGSEREQGHGQVLKPPFSKARCIAITFSIQATVIILPVIGRDLDIPSSRLQWIVSAYALAFGCFLLLWGRIADIYGKRTLFAAGTAWVAVVSAVNPFLTNEIAFSLFRGLHGLGAAANIPTAIGILGTTFPAGKAKNYAFSAYGAGAPLGSIFGTLIAGFISEYTSWKWVFGVMAILSGLVAAASILVIPPPPPSQISPSSLPNDNDNDETTSPDPTSPPPKPSLASVDWIGAALITTSIFALLFALTQGNVVGWSTPWVPALIAASLLVVAAFIAWQWHLENRTPRAPLMKPSLFRNRRFSAALAIMGFFFASFNNFLVFATYLYQDFQGLSTLQTTLRFLPTGVVGALVALAVAVTLHRVPTQHMLLFGTACVSLASLLFALPIPPRTSYFAYGLPAMALSVLGADSTWPPLTLYTSQALAPHDQALGAALLNAVGQVGRAIGLALATTVQAAVVARERGVPIREAGDILPWDHASLLGLRAANWTTFSLGVCSFLVVAVAFRNTGIVGKAPSPPAAELVNPPRPSSRARTEPSA